MGSSIPELGNSLTGSTALNPLFASILIPAILIVLLLGSKSGKWFAVGVSLGVASCLLVSAVISPQMWLLGEGAIARSFLIINALLCIGMARFASQES